jgi:hypothetical protein
LTDSLPKTLTPSSEEIPMHTHTQACCGHGHAASLTVDPRFADDEFTQAALDERRVRAAHAHGASMLLAILGGILLVGVAKMLCRSGR